MLENSSNIKGYCGVGLALPWMKAIASSLCKNEGPWVEGPGSQSLFVCCSPFIYVLFLKHLCVCGWTIFKVAIKFVTILLLFCVLAFWPLGSSLTRDRTHTPCMGWLSVNHWTAREIHILWLLPGSAEVKSMGNPHLYMCILFCI